VTDGPPAAPIAQLEVGGIETVIGTVVNPAGLTHAKMVPLRRLSMFSDPGLGASPVCHVFAIDQTTSRSRRTWG
jgi:glutamine synthetase